VTSYLDTCTSTVVYLSEHGICFSHTYPFSLGTEAIDYGRLINRNDINYIRVMRGIGEREREGEAWFFDIIHARRRIPINTDYLSIIILYVSSDFVSNVLLFFLFK
jgi:hypothetical protein